MGFRRRGQSAAAVRGTAARTEHVLQWRRRMTSTRPVLVVEDNEDTREMVREILAIAGFSSVGAANGREGLDALKRHHPCLILLDLSMPVMNGWQFRARQLDLPEPDLAETPVIVMSALTECGEVARALGAAGALPKPVDFDRLVDTIRQLC